MCVQDELFKKYMDIQRQIAKIANEERNKRIASKIWCWKLYIETDKWKGN